MPNMFVHIHTAGDDAMRSRTLLNVFQAECAGSKFLLPYVQDKNFHMG